MTTKYNICTIANDAYSDFLYYFTKSCVEKCTNLEKLNILYTGNELKFDPIYNHPKLKIYKYGKEIITNKIWDHGWQANIHLKTEFFGTISMNSEIPTFLIDADSYFLKEFIDLIDLDKDITVTKRIGHQVPYIASFIGFSKPKKCVNFIHSWRKEIQKLNTLPRETRGLVNAISANKEKFSFQELNESVISSIDVDNPTDDARILHYKGGRIGDAEELLSIRLNKLKNRVEKENV